MTDVITLPRSVVEQALEAFEHLVRRHYRLGTEHDSRAKALRAALDRPQVDQPAMTTIAQRKLDDLLLRGYTISGYSICKTDPAGSLRHGFVTDAGLVGWWQQPHPILVDQAGRDLDGALPPA